MSKKNFFEFAKEQFYFSKLEWQNFSLGSTQSLTAIKKALAAIVAIYIALSLGIPNPFWAGISAFVVTQTSLGSSLQTLIHRLAGTCIAAVLSVLLAWIFLDSFLLWPILFVLVTVSIYFSITTQYNYAWVIAIATLLMVDINSFVASDQIIPTAIYRALEVVNGCIVASIISWIFMPHYDSHRLDELLKKSIQELYKFYETSLEAVKKIDDDFSDRYTKMSTLLSAAENLTNTAKLEKVFSQEKLSLIKKVLSALREGAELIFNTQKVGKKSLTRETKTRPLANTFFRNLTEYLENNISEAVLLSSLKDWCSAAKKLSEEEKNFFAYLPLLIEKNLFSLENRAAQRSPLGGIIYTGRLNKIALTQAVKAAISVLIVPLIWIYFRLPGIDQIAISVIAILQVDQFETKLKGYARFLGCLAGSIVVYLFLGLSINNVFIFSLTLFFILFFFAYLRHDANNITFGTQAVVVIILGSLVNLAPTHSFELVLDRLVGIFAGVASIILIGDYLWPLTPKQFLIYYLEKVRFDLKETLDALISKTNSPTLELNHLRESVQNLALFEDAQERQSILAETMSDVIRRIYHDLFALDLFLSYAREHAHSPEVVTQYCKNFLQKIKTYLNPSEAQAQEEILETPPSHLGLSNDDTKWLHELLQNLNSDFIGWQKLSTSNPAHFN